MSCVVIYFIPIASDDDSYGYDYDYDYDDEDETVRLFPSAESTFGFAYVLHLESKMRHAPTSESLQYVIHIHSVTLKTLYI